MTREQLDEIICLAPDKIREQLGELFDHILESAASALEESQDSETGKVSVRINTGLKIDLTHSMPVFSVESSVSKRTKVVSEAIATRDPNQPELEMRGEA